MKLQYTKETTGETITVDVPVVKEGGKVGNCPTVADTRQWGQVPEGFELLTSYEGFEEGDCVFLAPKGAMFTQIKKGSASQCGTWKMYVIDERDHVSIDCQQAEGYGPQLCMNCSHSRGTEYADGYVAGCVNVKKNE